MEDNCTYGKSYIYLLLTDQGNYRVLLKVMDSRESAIFWVQNLTLIKGMFLVVTDKIDENGIHTELHRILQSTGTAIWNLPIKYAERW